MTNKITVMTEKQKCTPRHIFSLLFLVMTVFMSSSITLAQDTLTVTVNGKGVTFRDVPLSAWFTPFVRSIAQEGIVTGYTDEQGNPLGLFGPADPVTLEQLAKIAVEASGLNRSACSQSPQNPFARGRWSAEYVACAEAYRWNTYPRDVDVRRGATRAEVAETLARAFGLPITIALGDTFTDVAIATRYAASIEALAQRGIVSGYNDTQGNPTGRFGPEDQINRAAVAKMVWLAMEQEGRQPSDDSMEYGGSVEGEIRVEYGDLFFKPSTITVKKGEEVTIELEGDGFHTFSIEEFDIHVPLDGSPSSITFTPDQTGTFAYFCAVGMHAIFGMQGTLIVEE